MFGKSSTAAMQSEAWSAVTYHNKYVLVFCILILLHIVYLNYNCEHCFIEVSIHENSVLGINAHNYLCENWVSTNY